jgi:O-succinylbenzoic acid--CoA ligase
MKIDAHFCYNGISLGKDMGALQELKASASDWEQPYLDFIENWIHPDEELEVQTSGSTGVPVRFSASKEAMQSSARMTARFFHAYNGTRALSVLPVSYIAGKMMLVRAMTLGWNLTVLKPTAQPFSELIEAFDFAAFTPMQVADLSDEQLAILSQFGAVIVGGAPVSDGLRRKLALHCNTVYETYGMAETFSHVAIRKLTSEPTAFRAMEGVSFEVDDENRLRILAPHLIKEPLQTNDIVELVGIDSFHYKGRYDRMINSGGIKIFAEVIEEKLSQILEQPFIIGSVADEILGERVVLVIESQHPVNLDEVKAHISKVLERYEIPKEIRWVPELERTHSGKLKQFKK